MTRIGYDADSQVYTYRDADGALWEGASGAQYGTLRPAGANSPLPTANIKNPKGDEKPAPPLPDDAYDFLMLADSRRGAPLPLPDDAYETLKQADAGKEKKQPRSRYKPRVGSEASSSSSFPSKKQQQPEPPQRRKTTLGTTLGGLLQV